MQNIKTAISLHKNLFEQAEELARKKKVSRSRIFVLAMEEYLRRQENRDLLGRINQVYADNPDSAEKTLRRKSRRSHRRVVEGQW
jgi:metal-responsive CopG/Arc/MetJ family transcriptional regulator